MPHSTVCRRLAIILIRPSRYDDDGYVVRHWRGTLPSNTLSCLNGLTDDAVRRGALAGVDVDVHVLDEAVDRVDPRHLARRCRRPGSRTLVALAGVQTNQFPRARDLAREFRRHGCDVMMGGFHVSGSVAMSPDMPPECQALIDEGITLVAGEVECRWPDLLRDAAAGRLRSFYNFLDEPPDLSAQPLPRVSARLQRKFAVRGYGTIDAGRGCPFQCSFCTIINVQGRRMRSRGADGIVEHVRAHYRSGRQRGLHHYFFTDDNFARNPNWESILDGLIRLRREEGMAVDFMMQVDTAAARIPRLVEKAAAAGCVQVFIGMESLREDNLAAAGKRQNRVTTYKSAIARWHEAGILCHVGFIIGFPHDTYDRVMEDVRTLRDELLIDQASFFMLTPLPGSKDHRDAVQAGVPLDPDYNNFDSFHPAMPHPRMSRSEWLQAYRDAWTTFYSFEHMREALLRQNPHTYWGMLKCFLWYRAAMVEGAHPMVTGFVRLKDRRSRRPGWPIESRWPFLWTRTQEMARMARGYAGLLMEMEALWRATRIARRDYRGMLPRVAVRLPATLEIKTGWSELHASIRRRVADARATARTSALAARIEALGRASSADGDADRRPVAGTGRARTERDWRRLAFHPAATAWGLLRDFKNAAAFVVAMALERY